MTEAAARNASLRVRRAAARAFGETGRISVRVGDVVALEQRAGLAKALAEELLECDRRAEALIADCNAFLARNRALGIKIKSGLRRCERLEARIDRLEGCMAEAKRALSPRGRRAK